MVKSLATIFVLLIISSTIKAEWKKLNFTSQYTYAIEKYDSVMYIGANNGVYRSTDQGESWKMFNYGLTYNYTDIQVYSFKEIEGDFYLCCSTGAYKLSKNQNIWEKFCDNPGTSNILKMNNEFIVGTNGNVLYRSVDNGKTWTSEWDDKIKFMFYNAMVDWNGELYTATTRGLFKSKDIGKNWLQIDTIQVNNLEIINNKFYALTLDGLIENENNKWVNLGLKYHFPRHITVYKDKIFGATDLGFYVKTKNSDGWLPGSREFDTGQTMASLIVDNKIYVLTAKSLWVRDLDEFDLPELKVSDIVYENKNYHVGDGFYISAGYSNNGYDTLYVSNILYDSSDVTIRPRKFALGPDAGLGLSVYVKSRNPGKIKVTCQVISNDAINNNTFTIETNILPYDYYLSQNYPNPFNPWTQINYTIEKEEFVTIKIFNAIGQEVATALNEIVPGGKHVLQFKSDNLSSGVYYYQLKAGNFIETKKMVVIK